MQAGNAGFLMADDKYVLSFRLLRAVWGVK
jgi:hypothetical protein